MVIKSPIVPAGDSPPGVMPLTLPEPEDPDQNDGLTPANISAINGNDAPRWKIRPNAIRRGNRAWCLMPTEILFYIGMVGVPWYGEDHQTPPTELDFTATMWQYMPDGSKRPLYGRPSTTFSEACQVPLGWELSSQYPLPADISLPEFTGTNFYIKYPSAMEEVSSVTWDIISTGPGFAAVDHPVEWSVWNLWRTEAIDPKVYWSTREDVYIESYSLVKYGIFTAETTRRAFCVPAMFTILNLFFLLCSGANPPLLQSNAQRRRYVKKIIRG